MYWNDCSPCAGLSWQVEGHHAVGVLMQPQHITLVSSAEQLACPHGAPGTSSSNEASCSPAWAEAVGGSSPRLCLASELRTGGVSVVGIHPLQGGSWVSALVFWGEVPSPCYLLPISGALWHSLGDRTEVSELFPARWWLGTETSWDGASAVAGAHCRVLTTPRTSLLVSICLSVCPPGQMP